MTMMTRRVLLVGVLCVLWCGAVVAADAWLEAAADEVNKRAGEGITAGFEALSWQRAVLNNATDLLSAMDETLGKVKEAQAAADGINDPVLKLTAVTAANNLEKWVNAARTAAVKVKNARGSSAKERRKIQTMHEVADRAEAAAAAVRDAAVVKNAMQRGGELRAAAQEAAGLWAETVQRAETQLASASEAVNTTTAAVREAEAAERALRDEASPDAANVKQVVTDAKTLLYKLERKAKALRFTIQTVKEKSVVARNTYQNALAKVEALIAAVIKAEELKKQEEAEKLRKQEEAEKLKKKKEDEERKKQQEAERLKKLCSRDSEFLTSPCLAASLLPLLASFVATVMVAV